MNSINTYFKSRASGARSSWCREDGLEVVLGFKVIFTVIIPGSTGDGKARRRDTMVPLWFSGPAGGVQNILQSPEQPPVTPTESQYKISVRLHWI